LLHDVDLYHQNQLVSLKSHEENKMSLFKKHDETTAPEGASQMLAKAKSHYGFVPNLAAYVAESPAVLGAILKLSETFEQSSLNTQEQQVVLLTVSALNNCNYCKTVHTALGKTAEIDNETINNVIKGRPLGNKKLNALQLFTKLLIEEKGVLNEKQVKAFVDAGYTNAQVFEVIMGVALKTITNFSNHLAGAEPNAEFLAMASGKAAA